MTASTVDRLYGLRVGGLHLLVPSGTLNRAKRVQVSEAAYKEMLVNSKAREKTMPQNDAFGGVPPE
jgi:hypothetical protein